MFNIAFELPLHLDGIQILIHMGNLLILLIAIRVLLYKPVKKYMDKRSEEFKLADDKREANLKESDELKAKYEELMSNAKQEAVLINEQSLKQANERSNEIIASAKQKAENIIEQAENEINLKKTEQLEQAKEQIVDLACSLASDILRREFNKDDLDKQVDSLISDWKSNDA